MFTHTTTTNMGNKKSTLEAVAEANTSESQNLRKSVILVNCPDFQGPQMANLTDLWTKHHHLGNEPTIHANKWNRDGIFKEIWLKLPVTKF
jgi:hypothetical protein